MPKPRATKTAAVRKPANAARLLVLAVPAIGLGALGYHLYGTVLQYSQPWVVQTAQQRRLVTLFVPTPYRIVATSDTEQSLGEFWEKTRADLDSLFHQAADPTPEFMRNSIVVITKFHSLPALYTMTPIDTVCLTGSLKHV